MKLAVKQIFLRPFWHQHFLSVKHYLKPSRQFFWLFALFVILACFLTLKMFAINPYAGDEHIYLYQGKLVSEGAVPYSEFAMAHPPLQSLFTALLFKIFGYHFYLGRALPIFWAALCGLLVAVIAKRELGGIASLAAMAFFFFSYEPLRASSHYTGVNMTMALLMGAYLAYRTGYLRACAVLCVAAVFTRLYASPAVIALVVWAMFSDWRKGIRLMIWGVSIGTSAFLLTGLWSGFEDMIQNMLAYHYQKTPMKPERLANMQNTVLFHNATALSLFLLGLVAAFWTVADGWRRFPREGSLMTRLRNTIRRTKCGLPLLGGFAAFSLLAILLSLDRVWMYYFVPAFPFAAFAAGRLISLWLTHLYQMIRSGGRIAATAIKKPGFICSITLFLIFCASYLASPALESRLTYHQKAMKVPVERRVSYYTWQPGLLPRFMNKFIRRTLWQDQRIIGKSYPFYQYYLWHESRAFNILETMVADIVLHTNKTDHIFGDSGTVPMLALLSGRAITANEVDTNIQRYRSGNASPVKLVQKIDASKSKLIILRKRFGVAGLPELQRLIKKKYRLLRSYRTAQGNIFYMFKLV